MTKLTSGNSGRAADVVTKLMIVAGLAFLFAALWIHIDATLYQYSQEMQFAAEEPPPPAPDVPAPVSAPAPLVVPLTVPKPVLPTFANAPWNEDSEIVGKLEIPRLGLHVMIRNGDDDATLRRAVGLMPGTAQPGHVGNMVLTGHRDTFFRPLRGIEQGDKIQVRTRAQTHTYLVDSLMVVEPDYTAVLKSTAQPTATLVTCFPFDYIGAAPRRFIVKAHLVQ